MVKIREEIVNAMVQIIDMSASKGVFIGADLSTAGTVRDELVHALAESASSDEKLPAAETVEMEPSEK
jgi:hypothetical protein